MSAQNTSWLDIFVKKETCPYCNGLGCIECCEIDGDGVTDCVPDTCNYCSGRGYHLIYKKSSFITATLLVVALIILLIFLL